MIPEDAQSLIAELAQIEADIFNASTEFSKQAVVAAKSRLTYDLAYAEAILRLKPADASIKITVPEREALAIKQCSSQMTDARIAEAELDAAKKHLEALRAILSSIQTRASLLKAEAFAANIGA